MKFLQSINGISMIFMLYISFYYLAEYRKKLSKPLLLMFISFLLLAAGTFLLINSGRSYDVYLTGHAFSFAAYLVLLVNLFKSIKNGKKAK